jgi:large subunit ribosomal protein L21
MKAAVVEAGGKQFLAQEGMTIEVDRMPVEVGQQIDLPEVLLVIDGQHVKVGAPVIEGALVRATVVGQVKGPKIRVFKYIPKERYRRTKGHRQHYTRLSIESILLSGAAGRAAAAKPGVEAETAVAEAEARPVTRAAKPAARKPAPKAQAQKKPAAKKAAAKPKGEATRAKKPAAKKSK